MKGKKTYFIIGLRSTFQLNITTTVLERRTTLPLAILHGAFVRAQHVFKGSSE